MSLSSGCMDINLPIGSCIFNYIHSEKISWVYDNTCAHLYPQWRALSPQPAPKHSGRFILMGSINNSVMERLRKAENEFGY